MPSTRFAHYVENTPLVYLSAVLFVLNTSFVFWFIRFDPPVGVARGVLAALVLVVCATIVWNGYRSGSVLLAGFLACGVVAPHVFALSASGPPAPQPIVDRLWTTLVFAVGIGLGVGSIGHGLGWGLSRLR